MAEPVTPNKSYTIPNTGDLSNAWGGPINTNFTDIDTALAGSQSIALTSGGTVTMTSAQAQFLKTKLTGTLSADSVFQLPQVGGFYLINNAATGGYAVTCQTGATGGATVTLLPGWNVVFTDGTDVSLISTFLGDAPSVSDGSFGTGATAVGNSSAFLITCGSAAVNQGNIVFPSAAPHGWIVSVCNNPGLTVLNNPYYLRQIAYTSTQATIQQTDDSGNNHNFTNGQILYCLASPF